MPHDVFISYRDAANDKAEAERVCGHLEAEGFFCWIAPRDVLQGDDFGAAIVNAIQDCSVLVLIFSAAANSSRQIARELKLADDAKKTVLPIRIENVMPTGNCAYFLGAAQWLDAFGGIREEHLRRLASGLRTRLGTEPKILTRVNPADGLTYVFIPPGKFVMGCSPGDSERFDDEKPPHPEQIMNGFWLGQTPVTQAAWVKVMGGNASHFKGDRLPVENVDWTQAGDYCKAIGGRLPTEMEWEYAVRAGTTGGRYGLLDDVAWYWDNSGGTTHPVGLKQANAFGLYDMLGNVWEWVSDEYEAGHDVVRGGSWSDLSRFVRASYRGWSEPTRRDVNLGFRCVGEFR